MTGLRCVVLALPTLSASREVLVHRLTVFPYDLEAGAKRLSESTKNEMEVEHRPLSFPEGICGDYDVWLQAVRSDTPWLLAFSDWLFAHSQCIPVDRAKS